MLMFDYMKSTRELTDDLYSALKQCGIHKNVVEYKNSVDMLEFHANIGRYDYIHDGIEIRLPDDEIIDKFMVIRNAKFVIARLKGTTYVTKVFLLQRNDTALVHAIRALICAW